MTSNNRARKSKIVANVCPLSIDPLCRLSGNQPAHNLTEIAETPTPTSRPTLHLSPNRAARRAQFKKLGAAISAIKIARIGDPGVNDYLTGKESLFEPKSGDTHDRLLHEIPMGPAFKTPQWVRTVHE